MNTQKLKSRIILLVGIVGLSFLLFGIWYVQVYGMGIAEDFEVNNRDAETKILIATQQSQYKDEFVDAITSRLKPTGTYLKVIDVISLNKINPEYYDAIVIIHTWEIGEPPTSVSTFLATNKVKNLYTIATSGNGSAKIEGIDGMSSASLIIDLDVQVTSMMNWLHEKHIKLN